MFGISDIPKFIFAFFLVLPVITFLHEAGHVFFAWLMGGKNIQVTIGSGKPLFKTGILEIRQYYFWYGFCSFDNIKPSQRLPNILVFAGGTIFNALGAIVVGYLVKAGTIEPNVLTYQFIYFSLYFIFFSVLPMPYPDGNFSDGKFILDLIRNKHLNDEKVYRLTWQEKKKVWCLEDRNGVELLTSEEAEEAMQKSREIALKNRPSRLLLQRDKDSTEEYNFPRIPQ